MRSLFKSTNHVRVRSLSLNKLQKHNTFLCYHIHICSSVSSFWWNPNAVVLKCLIAIDTACLIGAWIAAKLLFATLCIHGLCEQVRNIYCSIDCVPGCGAYFWQLALRCRLRINGSVYATHIVVIFSLNATFLSANCWYFFIAHWLCV